MLQQKRKKLKSLDTFLVAASDGDDGPHLESAEAFELLAFDAATSMHNCITTAG